MYRMRYFLTHVLPVLAWMGLIFFFSSQSGEQISAWAAAILKPFVPSSAFPGGASKFVLQKSAHFFEYAVLSMLLLRALKPILAARMAYFGAVAVSVLYAVSDEWHQSFVPGRGPSLRDVGIDTCGALAGVLVVFFLTYINRYNTLPDRGRL